MLHQTGSGVSGPVFRAFDSRRDCLVAVKAFRLDLLPEDVVRCADALRRLALGPAPHPALVPLIDVGLEGTTPYLVMAYQSGETLDVWLRSRAPMPFDQALPVLRPIASAIDAAAAVGILHGALHPRDIFVSDRDASVVVTGFGIAAALAAAGVERSVRRRPYAAPERTSPSWDVRADIYSLGVIAHELFTGRRTTVAGEQDGVFAKALSPEQRVQLRRVLASALAESSVDRFTSASAFLDALDEVGGRATRVDQVAAAPAIRPDDNGEFFAAPMSSAPAESFARDTVAEPATAVPLPAFEVSDGHAVMIVTVAASDALAFTSESEFDARSAAEPVRVAEPSSRGRRWRPRMTAAAAAAGLAAGVIGAVMVAGLWTSAPDTVPADVTVAVPADVTTAAVDAAPEPSVTDASAGVAVRAEPSRDARPAVVASGRLTIRSQPSGALVTIDGRSFGETPLVARDVPLGTHAVRVAHPGHVPRSEQVTLRASTPTRTLNVTLRPGLEPAAATRGSIDVDSRPRGARVSVDGRFVGLAPLRVADVEPGEHLITVEYGGYRPATGRVQVDAGRARAMRITLAAED